MVKTQRTWIVQNNGAVLGTFQMDDDSVNVPALRAVIAEKFELKPPHIAIQLANGELAMLDSEPALKEAISGSVFSILVPVLESIAQEQDGSDFVHVQQVPIESSSDSGSDASSDEDDADSVSSSSSSSSEESMSDGYAVEVAKLVSVFDTKEDFDAFLSLGRAKRRKVKKVGVSAVISKKAAKSMNDDQRRLYEASVISVFIEPAALARVLLPLGIKPKALKRSGMPGLGGMLKEGKHEIRRHGHRAHGKFKGRHGRRHHPHHSKAKHGSSGDDTHGHGHGSHHHHHHSHGHHEEHHHGPHGHHHFGHRGGFFHHGPRGGFSHHGPRGGFPHHETHGGFHHHGPHGHHGFGGPRGFGFPPRPFGGADSDAFKSDEKSPPMPPPPPTPPHFDPHGFHDHMPPFFGGPRGPFDNHTFWRGRGRGVGRGGRSGGRQRGKGGLGEKKQMARLVMHKNVEDGTQFPCGTDFNKSWVIRNDSKDTWPHQAQLVHIGGDVLHTESTRTAIVPALSPGQQTEVSIGPLRSPELPGLYKSFFRLQSVGEEGQKSRFGQRLWCSVFAVDEKGRTASASQSPAGVPVASAMGEPKVEYLS